jgi:metal-responsive CopG/Arc/MetJ family transcriptional regulator
MGKVNKITISLPADLVTLADHIAHEKKTNRSQVISECLKDLAAKRQNAILQEGYLSMSEEHRQAAEYFRSAQSQL